MKSWCVGRALVGEEARYGLVLGTLQSGYPTAHLLGKWSAVAERHVCLLEQVRDPKSGRKRQVLRLNPYTIVSFVLHCSEAQH